MFAAKFSPFIMNTSKLKQLCKIDNISYNQVVSVMNWKKPPSVDDVEFPEKRKLKVIDRSPYFSGQNQDPPMKFMKRLRDMRGPELIHNKLQYGEYGIQATCGGKMRWGHLEMIRMSIVRGMRDTRMFAIWRVETPWKAVGKKGLGQRMGGGKSPIDHYVYPVKAQRIIMEVGGVTDIDEVNHILKQAAASLPFQARVVSHEILEREAEKEKYIEENNINPFSFKDSIRKNYLGCKTWISPFDFKWDGKYK
ncbi:hypothetical protein LOTGIDRAFT_150117 [Lottia gigantea]|uniref:Large ribosomal subunit protein uL16m n=1 Tax=Lottia gigantea TaxID=225164 RepID=V3ZVC6_LOTGI|nr:hypothetical protein LOTGIDRAFT_150117 [Lottia gigantea]ESO95448.1 hypothetical protein LOTGIDRAFT_150117 [Lottia gigantea]